MCVCSGESWLSGLIGGAPLRDMLCMRARLCPGVVVVVMAHCLGFGRGGGMTQG